jgi:hypothetical protein
MYKTTPLIPFVAALALAAVSSQSASQESGAANQADAAGTQSTTGEGAANTPATPATASTRVASDEDSPCGDGKGPCCEMDWRGQGATIVKMQGDVLVSQSPWVNATLGMRVENGGRVMTLDQGSAVCAFDDGCWHVLGENDLVSVADVSPCCGPPPVTPAAAPVPPPALPSPFANPAWLIPVVPIAALGALAAADDDDDDSDPGPPQAAISPPGP